VGTKITAFGSGSGVPEAPSDGNTYGRKDTTWVTISGVPITQLDGGAAASIYLISQVLDGGGA